MSHRANTTGWLSDGNLSFYGGADASVPPSDIARTQVAKAINCTMRGGPIRHRPGWKKKVLRFPEEDPTGIQDAFKNTRFQHASFYSSNQPSLISSHGGRLFLINLTSFTVQEITPLKPDGSLDRNSAFQELGWAEQMGTYWAYQDNQSFPIIFNGSGCRRSDPAKSEIPVGNVMAYAQGRLTVALPDRHTFRVGDLLFGPSGTQANSYRDAVLKFTENNFLNEGGDFQARIFGAPSDDGPITAMKSLAQQDTQLGQGPLIVGTPYDIWTIQLPFDRTTWKDLANPLQTVSPMLGPMGNDSMVLVNGDIWYRGMDGIRSYIMGRRQFGTWGNTSMSSEISPSIDPDTQSLLEHGSAVLFDNRLLTTVSPSPTSHGVFHRGLAVIDFHLVSTISRKLNPVWEGIWTGINILQIIKGMVNKKERCFAYVLNCNNEIELWENIPNSKFDEENTRIEWSFDLPSYNCGNSDQHKKLETARIIMNDLVGQVDLTASYRTDLNPCLTPWDTYSACAKFEDCDCTDQQTTTTAPFVVLATPTESTIAVASTAGFTLDRPNILAGPFPYKLTAIVDSTHIKAYLIAPPSAVGDTINVPAKILFCGFSCDGPKTFKEQQRTPIRLHMPPDDSDPVSGHFLNRGYEFQPRLEIVGSAAIRQIRIFAKDEPDILGADRGDEI